jgi:hypothetical protein
MTIDGSAGLFHNLRLVEGSMQRLLRLLQLNSGSTQGMAYQGDVNDTPPGWVRAVATLACLFGGCFMLYFLILGNMFIGTVVVGSALLLATFLILTVPRASQTALVAVAFWGLLGGFALFVPFNL